MKTRGTGLFGTFGFLCIRRDKVLANQVLYKIINDIKEIAGTECSVWNTKGSCLAYTDKACEKVAQEVRVFLTQIEEYDERKTSEAIYFLVSDEGEPAYVLVLHEAEDMTQVVGRLGVSQFENLLYAYKQRADKNHFFQNLLLDNLLLVDILNQAKKLGVDNEQRRIVFLIEPKHEGDNLVLETLKGIYITGTKDFVTSVDERHIVFVKSLEKNEKYTELAQMAKSIVATMDTEAMVSVRVSYGTIVDQLKDVSKSYKEASMALDVGRVFYAGKNVLAYNELGIGRLIHQLPTSLCEMFLDEVFAGKAMDQFDDETLTTVNQFFVNNLNISETARHLYIHRNTLVYRLEKIQRTTGLDVRVFDDALTFKIAMMVSLHMKSVNEAE